MGFLSTLGRSLVSAIPGVGPAISAGLDIAGGLIQGKASNKAAQQQQAAVGEAVNTEKASNSQSQLLARQFYNDVQGTNEATIGAGNQALGQESAMTGPGGELDTYRPQTWDKSFDPSTVQIDPAFQFRLKSGSDAILAARSATGTLRGGATDKKLEDYAQGLSSEEYAAADTRARQTYADQESAFRANQAAIEKNQADRFARLNTVTQTGRAAAEDTNAAAKTFGTEAVSSESQTGKDVADLLTQGGNAAAAGTVGKANAVSGAMNNVADQLTLQQLLKKQKAVNTIPPGFALNPEGGG